MRGPFSSLYGSEALGGVIQIFTRRPQGRFVPTLSVATGSDNARRYGGGEVTCTVERTEAGMPGAQVRVCDRGPGVPEAMRERIFEPFFRLPGHAEHAGGVGLGLSLVKQIAERHGGRIRCEPREGGGSCFRLSLPGR